MAASKLEITPTRLCDVWEFNRMRQADAVEVRASGGYEPVEAVLESWAGSAETWTARINGEVACVYGVAIHSGGSDLLPVGVVWLLTTDTVDRNPITFFRASKKIVKDLSERYGTLMNYVDARYEQALEWAKRVGFTVYPAVPFGVEQRPFHPIAYGG